MSKKAGRDVPQETARKGSRRTVALSRVRWFNPAPNDFDKQWMGTNDDKLLDLSVSLIDAIPEVGRLTVKYDLRSGRWLAILFVSSSSGEHELDALSVRGGTAVDALSLLAYTHFVKFEEAWVEDAGEPDSRWG